jgi:hypothetical protein
LRELVWHFFPALDACVNFFFRVDRMCISSPFGSVSGNVPVNEALEVFLTAAGNATPDGGFEVTADPVVAIEDELIPGTSINYRDAFTLVLSPGVTQSLAPGEAAVPEPATRVPLVVALAAIWFSRAKTRFNSQAPHRGDRNGPVNQ